MEHHWTFPVKQIDGNYDGDTINVELDLGFRRYGAFSCRIASADTPEIKGGTPETRALARYARDRALAFLREAEVLVFHSTKWAGKYGRPIGEFIADGKSLSEWLIEENLAVPYDGGSRAGILGAHQINALRAIEDGRIRVRQ